MGRVIRRWALRLCVVAVLAVLFVFDARMKTTDSPGFRPQDVQWVAYAPNFGRFWSGVTRSDTFRAFRREWPRPYRDLQLAVRKATGIRPLPVRWSLWMGSGLLGFGTADGTGYCVRPGLLLRVAHFVNAPVSGGSDGTYRYGDLTYVWRDGFLLFSTSPKVLAEAMRGSTYAVESRLAPNELQYEWYGAPALEVVLRAERTLPIRGSIHVPSPPPASSKSLGEIWPRKPLVTMTAPDCAQASMAAGWLQRALAAAPDWAGLDTLVPDWSGSLPGDFTAERCAFAILAPGSAEGSPGFAEIVRVSGLPPAVGASGGPPFTAATGLHWFAADTPELLSSLQSSFKESSTDAADLVVRIDWKQWSEFLQRHLRARLQADESLQESIEGTGLPAARAIGKLGQSVIFGHAEGDSLSFEGRLFDVPPAEEAGSEPQ